MKSLIFSEYDRPMVLGHRGVPEEHQENTMAGFKRAVELGLDGVELDVFLTRDNKLVVFHDLDTQRLTGVPGLVSDMTWDQLRALDICQSIDVGDRVIDYGRPEKIALLEDVLEETRGKLIVNIEIKAYRLDFQQRHTGVEVAKLIRHMNLFQDVFVTSFNFWPLLYLERTCQRIESGFTYSPDLVKKGSLLHHLMESSIIGKLIGSTATNMSVNMFDGNTIENVQRRGLAVGAWTLFCQDCKWLGVWLSEEDELNYIRNFTERGIDYFIADDPVRLQRVIRSLVPDA